MKQHEIADLLLYKARYVLGYTVLALLFIGGLLMAGLYAPGGLVQAEIDAIAVTNSLSLSDPTSLAQPNILLHGLQRLSFWLFGVSELSIKLPAMLLSVVSALAIFFLLRRWFRPNIAILSLLIMTTTGQLLYVGQQFSPHILYIVFSALILLFASLILQRAAWSQLWKISLAITAALSLYTPYFWYINLGLLLVALLHPHTRYFLLSRKQRLSWLPAGIVFGIIVAPLLYACIVKPALASQLLGLSTLDFSLITNLKILVRTYVWPYPTVFHGQIAPIIDISSLILIILGLAMAITRRQTARSYMIGAWLLLAMPLLLMQPTLTVIITIPLLILLAVGVETLIREWYKLFPKNPYARATGLVLMIGLIGVMVLGGIDRYVQGYRHLPEAISATSTDARTLRSALTPGQSAHIVASAAELPLYQAMAHQQPDLTASTELPASYAGPVYVSRSRLAEFDRRQLGSLQRILVNDRSDAADRFYVYKKAAK